MLTYVKLPTSKETQATTKLIIFEEIFLLLVLILIRSKYLDKKKETSMRKFANWEIHKKSLSHRFDRFFFLKYLKTDKAIVTNVWYKYHKYGIIGISEVSIKYLI